MELDKKRWRVNKKDNWPYCDGDCYSWGNGLCTCGLVHHLHYFHDKLNDTKPDRLERLERQQMVALGKLQDPAWVPKTICDECGQKYTDELFAEWQIKED